MFGTTWYHGVLRKYVVLFGTLFNNIYINRQDKNGEVIQTLKIPLSYGPKEKFLARLDGDPTLDNQVAITLPRIAFEMTTFNYAPERKLNKLNKIYKQVGNVTNSQYQPVPYDISFSLYIMVKNVDDGTRIIEQILPYFTPDWVATVILSPDVGGTYDVPIIINSVSVDDSYEGSFEQRRAVIWTLTFTMKGMLFGPTRTSNLIKFVDANIILSSNTDVIDTNATTESVHINVVPGLTAEGEPTSNSALSIPYTEINADDNYGFITDITENI